MDYIKENCPLCDKPSKYYFVDKGNRKFFHCEYCTDFQVYIYAEKRLASAPKEWKEQMSKASHDSDHERVLFITYSIVKSRSEDDYVFRAEFHDRATLPLS